VRPGAAQERTQCPAQHAQQVWASHADIARASLGTIPTGLERLRVIEGLLAILRGAGFSGRVAAWAVDRLQIFIDADVSEGGLEPPYRCDFPGSGKSCNKGNMTGADAPGYSAACSLSGPLPGLYVTVRQVHVVGRHPAPGCSPRVSGSRAVRAGGAAFCDELEDVRVRHCSAGDHLRDAVGRTQSRLSWHVTLRHYRSCR
jgi:hypothetical protein